MKTTNEIFNFRLEYSNYKGEVVIEPPNIIMDKLLYGKTEVVSVYLDNKFPLVLEVEDIECVDGDYVEIERFSSEVPISGKVKVFDIKVSINSQFSQVDFADLSSPVKYSELESNIELLDTYLTAVKVKTNLISELLIPIALNTAHGNIVDLKSIKFSGASISRTSIQYVELNNPTDQPIAFTFLLSPDSRVPERKKCDVSCQPKAKIPDITFVDDDEFEHIDPKDVKF